MKAALALVSLLISAVMALAAASGEGVAAPEPIRGLDSLNNAELAGQRIVTAFSGTSVPDDLRWMIERGEVAGVVLFAANAPSLASIRETIADLQAIRRPPGLEAPLLIMVDQEGGLVKRLDVPPNASAEQMGARGAKYSRRQGAATGKALAELGINVNLAPVLDVRRPGGAIDNENRSFGTTAEQVIETALPFSAAQRRAGVASTAKHFPGFGAAAVNTDDASTVIEIGKGELRETDLAPFARFSEQGGELVMSALAVYPAFSDRPAAFTRSLVTGELRRRIGFEGVIATDSLNAAAALNSGRPAAVAFAAARAGNDLLLYTGIGAAAAAQRTLERRLDSGKLDRDEAERSVARVLALRDSLGG